MQTRPRHVLNAREHVRPSTISPHSAHIFIMVEGRGLVAGGYRPIRTCHYLHELTPQTCAPKRSCALMGDIHRLRTHSCNIAQGPPLPHETLGRAGRHTLLHLVRRLQTRCPTSRARAHRTMPLLNSCWEMKFGRTSVRVFCPSDPSLTMCSSRIPSSELRNLVRSQLHTTDLQSSWIASRVNDVMRRCAKIT